MKVIALDVLLVTGLDVALRADIARARDAVRAERDNAAERLLLAVGGVSMGRVARACNGTRLRTGAPS